MSQRHKLVSKTEKALKKRKKARKVMTSKQVENRSNKKKKTTKSDWREHKRAV